MFWQLVSAETGLITALMAIEGCHIAVAMKTTISCAVYIAARVLLNLRATNTDE
jgi:hypothetical protein